MKYLILISIFTNFIFVSTVKAQDKEVLYWVAPMDANYRRDQPGKSPMGMDLVPVYADEVNSDGGISISPKLAQNLGIRTQKVERSKLWQMIKTVGEIKAAKDLEQDIQIHSSGWIEKLNVFEIGETVTKGQPLFTLYSHDLVNAEQDYLQIQAMGNRSSIQAAKQRLLTLGLSKEQIAQLSKTKNVIQSIEIKAPQSGIITKFNLVQGQYLQENSETLTISDISRIWMIAEISEKQSSKISLGNPVDIIFSSSTETIEAKVDYIYPIINPKTRTLPVRIEIDNSDNQLKIGNYAQLKIYAGAKDNILIVPSQAVIRSGDSNRVIVADEDNLFQAKTVQLGIESGEFTEIISGLDEGDNIVVSGQFLIDSESSLKAGISRLSE